MHAHTQYDLKYINNVQSNKIKQKYPLSKRLFSSFSNFEHILIHVREQIIRGYKKSPSAHTQCLL